MKIKNYRNNNNNNNKKFHAPHSKYNKFSYNNKNVYKDGRKEETRVIIDQAFEDNAPYIKYDLQELLYDDKFVEKATKYQECRVLRVICQVSALKERGLVKVYYNDLLNEQVKYVVFPTFKSIDLRWHNIRNNTFDYIDMSKFGQLCFVNKNQLKLKCQIRVIIIFRGERSEPKDINWKIINNGNKSIKKNSYSDISKNSQSSSISSISKNNQSSSFSLSFNNNSTDKGSTTFQPSGKNVVFQEDVNDFSKLMANRLFKSYEEFLDNYYLKRRKAKNLLDKEKRKFNKLAGELKDVSSNMKNEIELIKSGFIEEKVEEHVKNLKGTIALVNNKIKQYDEKLGEYSNVDMNLKVMSSAFTKMVQDILKLQKCVNQISKECRDNSNKISILQDTKKDDDDIDLESDFLAGYKTDQPKKKNVGELFDVYDEAVLYMKDKYKKVKERKLHKIVYDELLHKYKIV